MIINEERLNKVGLTPTEFFSLFTVKIDGTLNLSMSGLYNKRLIVGNNKHIRVTKHAVDIIDFVTSENGKDGTEDKSVDYTILAEKLIKIFPDIMQPSTGRNVRSNVTDVANALKSFDMFYDVQCTDEQILDATKRYIEHFGGNYQYILTLADFIYNSSIRTGEFKRHSELADYLNKENHIIVQNRPSRSISK